MLKQVLRRFAPKAVRQLGSAALDAPIGLRDRLQGFAHGPRHYLSEMHVAGCTVFASREALLEHMPKGSVVAELGVNRGDFSAQILQITQPKELHLVDVWADGSNRYPAELLRSVEERFANQIRQGHVVIERGLSTEVLARFPDAHFDWVYIDTAHDYRTTAAELELAARKVKADGIIAGHDYTTRGADDAYKYGVIEAVHEHCLTRGWKLVYTTLEPHGHNSFALRRL